MYDRDALAELIRKKALRFGDFTLASGKKATYYLDCKQVTLDPCGARSVAEGILDLLLGEPLPNAIGGMAIGADPITASVVTMSDVRGTPITGFMIRKDPKGHGTNQYVEGPVQPGNEVVIVEDVVTTGGSSLAAISAGGVWPESDSGDRDHRSHGRGGGSLCPAGVSLCQPVFDPRLRNPAAGEMRK